MKRILLTLCSLALLTPAFAASVKDLVYRTNDNGTITITDCYDDASGELIIPATINGKKVNEIGKFAFGGCSSLTSVIIPKGVTSIGDYAFRACYSLTSVTILEGVTEIGGAAFFGCSSLASVTIPKSMTTIEGSTFDGCSSLTSVEIPSSVTEIEEYAFYGCSSLTSVVIPEGVTSIGRRTFAGCSSLTSVTIPEGVTEIGRGAFSGCTAMKEMIFNGPPPNVEPLDDKDKYDLEREGVSNPETLPATKGYYLPEHAEAWKKVLGGETGEWNNLQMQLIPEDVLAKLKAAEDFKGTTQSASSSILWIILAFLGGVITTVAVTVFIFKKKRVA